MGELIYSRENFCPFRLCSVIGTKDRIATLECRTWTWAEEGLISLLRISDPVANDTRWIIYNLKIFNRDHHGT